MRRDRLREGNSEAVESPSRSLVRSRSLGMRCVDRPTALNRRTAEPPYRPTVLPSYRPTAQPKHWRTRCFRPTLKAGTTICSPVLSCRLTRQSATTTHSEVPRVSYEVSGMRPVVAPQLSAIFDAASDAAREDAWGSFVREFSDQILRVARSLGGDYDLAMDRYAFVLERLQEDDCRRLRSYARPGAGEFRLWLIVVVRRLCLDHHRQRYGRARESVGPVLPEQSRAGRRRLADLVSDQIDPALLPASPQSAPDAALARSERSAALAAALQKLPASDRLLLRLRFAEELPALEIARVMRLPTVFHVYRRLNAAFRALRDSLREEGVLDAEP
jgi:RNA polymerase sigma factor (sigma-70 family)